MISSKNMPASLTETEQEALLQDFYDNVEDYTDETHEDFVAFEDNSEKNNDVAATENLEDLLTLLITDSINNEECSKVHKQQFKKFTVLNPAMFDSLSQQELQTLIYQTKGMEKNNGAVVQST